MEYRSWIYNHWLDVMLTIKSAQQRSPCVCLNSFLSLSWFIDSLVQVILFVILRLHFSQDSRWRLVLKMVPAEIDWNIWKKLGTIKQCWQILVYDQPDIPHCVNTIHMEDPLYVDHALRKASILSRTMYKSSFTENATLNRIDSSFKEKLYEIIQEQLS